MLATSWPSTAGHHEYALAFDQQRERRLLIIPALFDEANKLRRFTVEVMRKLDATGIDSFLPDLPGTNESLAPLAEQTLSTWRDAMEAAASHFGANHVLAIRGGALANTGRIPALHYAPVAGGSQLRGMLRAQVIAAKEAGDQVSRETLLEVALAEGVTLAGHEMGAAMVAQLQEAVPPEAATTIAQIDIGGPGLWLRAEPDHAPDQADKLAALVAEHVR